PAAPGPAPAQPPARPPTRPTADTVWVSSPLYRVGFTTRGARLVAAEFREYRSFAPGDSGRAAQIVPPGRPFLGHRLVVGADTIRLDAWDFHPSARDLRVDSSGQVRFTAASGPIGVELEYRFSAGDYRFAVAGRVTGLPSGATLLLELGDGLRSVEADSADDYRRFSMVRKQARTESSALGSFDPGELRVFDGPFEWVGIKSKYFLVAALAVTEGRPPFGGALVQGVARPKRGAPRAAVVLTLPVPPGGEFAYEVYAGPLEHERLVAIGHGFDDANPYGWSFLRPIIHPVSVVVVDILLWMHDRLNIAYGWVLVIFGVLVRLLLWPLNQKAMESSLRMQAVAPLIKDVQERYKKDPERLQKEMLRLYREHKINPFGGCLPMLLPLPVLFALFFVFDNTIAFRGVPFLWLPDLSRADPTYIIPLLMGASMFALMRLGQIGVPPNPQSRMMLYVMPVMMVVFFFRLASGLNLYYTVQNLLSLPQQYWIARRRLRQQAGKG
ncbi:MAG TPA: YidC/Oxa1 family insertase periplasmic-domain containing protein, partial [Gemmatimonadales bacterium]|nr:YidC/Oxa1 family insertase periplasmic-domain containing protein [Gemmatimonadales bacterium]